MIASYRDKLNKARGKYETLVDSRKSLTDRIAGQETRLQAIEQAQALIQKVAQETQSLLIYQIDDVVQTCLDTVFPDEYTFHVLFEIKRNKTEARLCFTKNGIEIDPMLASGGGVVDVAALGLRIAAWSLGTTDNVLILDESFKFLSRDLQPRIAEIIQEISKKLDLQIISVTHSPDMIENSDKVFTVTLKKGSSNVTVNMDS